ncbi:MAG: Dabb family protein [Zetaproteobacteria bacterium]|nr:MAG: Dabb family protein [Zetaproteobacteria bacterium]
MVKHIVLWTLKETAGGRTARENALEIQARLEALNGHIPGLLTLEVGIDFGRTASSADVALYAEFADRRALDAYQAHPDHAAAAEFVGRVRERRVVVDYEA